MSLLLCGAVAFLLLRCFAVFLTLPMLYGDVRLLFFGSVEIVVFMILVAVVRLAISAIVTTIDFIIVRLYWNQSVVKLQWNPAIRD